MKTYKSRNNNSSSIATRARKTARSQKRLRRLQRPVDDDEDEEVEIELSPGSSSPAERKRSREDKETSNAAVFDNPLCFIDFETDGDSADVSAEDDQGIISTACWRDVDQHPLLSDEMDQLQFELEKSLAQAILSQRKLRTALKYLTAGTAGALNGQANSTDSSSRQATSTQSAGANKRKYPKNQQVSKKPASVGVSTAPAAAKKNRPAGKKDPRHESTASCSRSYYYAQQHHQMPDKFWTFVDQYAGSSSLTASAEALRELIHESHPAVAQSKAYYELPENKHSKRRPSSASPLSPRAHGSKSVPNKNPKMKVASTSESRRDFSPNREDNGSSRTLRASDSAQLRKRDASTPLAAPSAKKARDNHCSHNGTASNTRSQSNSTSEKNGFSLGPLTERLVQALIEECGTDIGEYNKNGQITPTDAKNGISAAANSKGLMKSLNLGNLKALENRIRKELIEQGLLDAADDQMDKEAPLDDVEPSLKESRTTGRLSSHAQFDACGDDDEVTAELKLRQNELQSLQHDNYARLSNLLDKVETRLEDLSKEEKLKAADDEVLELCARYYGVAPASRKPANKKERDVLMKALKDREKAMLKLKSQS